MMNCIEIETLVAQHWNVRQNIIVPNVHWGLNLHECDLLILSNSNYATEIEIKVSKSDLKKDLEKKHQHKSKLIKFLYFAIPESLETEISFIPEHAGIIVCREFKPGDYHPRIKIIRQPKRNEFSVRWNDKQVQQLMRLGCMRIWSLKHKVVCLLKDRQSKQSA
jgi:hypothetical protein